MLRNALVFFYLSSLFSACISNRQVQYLQKDDVNAENLEKDSVVRSYALIPFDYKIQPHDILSVRFESLTPDEFDFFSNRKGQENINFAQGGIGTLIMGELVDPEGNLPFPVVGKVPVAGLNVFQIQDSLQHVADQYLASPLVKVRLLNYRITVMGEVNQESSITLFNNRTSILEAIGLAGGLGEFADRSNVKLIRQIGDQTEVAYLNLLDENFIASPYYYVHQNDIILVPPLRQRPFRKYFGQNLALVASALTLLLLAYNIAN